MRSYALLLVFLVLVSSCMEEPIVPVPAFGSSGLIAETYRLSDSAKCRLEGIYDVIDGRGIFGSRIVARWNGDFLSIFSGSDMYYMILQAGYLDSVIIIEGYWRNLLNVETGLVRLTIKKNEGGKEIIYGCGSPKEVIIRGSFGIGFSLPNSHLSMRLGAPLSRPGRDFWIIGHRGGGRTTDLLPASENSLGILRFAERLGCNGVEIDVRLTSDGVPILFHDQYFSSRLVDTDFLIGEVSSYTFRQIRTYCTLTDGSPVPSLREALDVILYETNLTLVWIDTKARNCINQLISLQKEYHLRARESERDLEILIGIPDAGILEDFLAHPSHRDAPALCELDPGDVGRSGAVVWAPRWTLGTLLSDVDKMHLNGVRSFVWTLDDPDFIRAFIRGGRFDGILSNYPTKVAWEHYLMESEGG